MRYIHERPEWPDFHWNMDSLAGPLAAIRHKQGLLLGRMNALGFSIRAEAGLETLTLDVVKSSAIEGEVLDMAQVRSSLARRLGIDIGGLAPVNRNVEGIVEMMLDATQRYAEPLTVERLFGWHAALFPMGYGVSRRITVGAWRTPEAGPMQVVSGYVGHEKVHFEAPAAERLDREMTRFLDWFNTPRDLDPVLKAGIAHLWFVTIHPFEDGNGRIARAIADCALARADDCPQRFYSMSGRIERERKDYYDVLERTQKGGLDITPWLDWFLGCLGRAIDGAEETLGAVFRKARVWQHANQFQLNERQRGVINRLLDGFEGKLTSGKYAKLTKCSPDTALRDIRELVGYGILKQSKEGGRSTSYTLPDTLHNEE
ncbi:Filamentation induced by cAMP protein Fic [uncultured delta proteobacterium]|uniref:Filamentation induced by cAMP protein Fic n=1 Tax=uncultured delta proteobacterium TaxID=34034 RepID=A0A212K232_9DELT|nr:Filamentation induced by cAMP protein Fic [uncultured delta proteobacterium]